MSELPETSTGQLMAVDHPRLVRPDAGGWWDWYQGQSLDDDPEDWDGAGCERLLLCEGGTHVVDDDEYERVTGQRSENEGWSYNYWEGTETTQRTMPGLWVRANVGQHLPGDSGSPNSKKDVPAG